MLLNWEFKSTVATFVKKRGKTKQDNLLARILLVAIVKLRIVFQNWGDMHSICQNIHAIRFVGLFFTKCLIRTIASFHQNSANALKFHCMWKSGTIATILKLG